MTYVKSVTKMGQITIKTKHLVGIDCYKSPFT